ncbi:MAG: PEP-CTERM sorting domain-containing protein [Phycisphaerae bacterium]|nr:PEP-CTERM sorting domain-containing protein [Phycisphaerae bacterium]
MNPPASGEPSQQTILDHFYGGTFSVAPGGLNFSNGTLTAVRVSDNLPSSSSSANPGPDATDRFWQANAVYANAKAIFSATPASSFGYINGTSGGSYHSLFSITGDDYTVSGSGSIPNPQGQTWRWGFQSQFGLLSSNYTDNPGGTDHMVTYQLQGLNDNFTTWLLFFEDNGASGTNADFDFNDLVVELKTNPTSTVPEPGTILICTGAGLLMLRRWRYPM